MSSTVELGTEVGLQTASLETVSSAYDIAEEGFTAAQRQVVEHLAQGYTPEYRDWVEQVSLPGTEQYKIVGRIEELLGTSRHLHAVLDPEEVTQRDMEVDKLIAALYVGNLSSTLDLVSSLKRQGHRTATDKLLTEANRLSAQWFKRNYRTPERAKKAPVYPTDILTYDVLKPKLLTFRGKKPAPRHKPSIDNTAPETEAVEAAPIPEPENLRAVQPKVYQKIMGALGRGDEPVRGRTGMPTGSGKTVVFTKVLEARKEKAVICVPTNGLKTQTAEAMRKHGFTGSIGFVNGAYKDRGQYDAMITAYAGFVKHGRSVTTFALDPANYRTVILDEAHNALATGVTEVLNSKYEHADWLGFTATENYSEKEERQLKSLLPEELYHMTIAEAADEHMVAPFSVALLLTAADMSGVQQVGDDFNEKSLLRILNTPWRNRLIARAYAEHFASEHKAVFSTGTIAHAEDMAAALREEGIMATVIHGSISKGEQQAIKDALRSGDLQAVTQAKILGEGFDDPTISLGVNVTPTLSSVKSPQRSGRPLRIDEENPHKYAMILECIDRNYPRVPVLYTDPRAGGVYSAGWQHATPESLARHAALLEKLKGDTGAGLHFITEEDILHGLILDPSKVLSLKGFGQISHQYVPDLISSDETTRTQQATEAEELTRQVIEEAMGKNREKKGERSRTRSPRSRSTKQRTLSEASQLRSARREDKSDIEAIYQQYEEQGYDPLEAARSIDRGVTDYIALGEPLSNIDPPTIKRVLRVLAGTEVLKNRFALERFGELQEALMRFGEQEVEEIPARVSSYFLPDLVMDKPAWHEDAECAGNHTVNFYAARGESTAEAKAICEACLVKDACLQFALQTRDKFGIWGGLSERQRRKLRKAIKAEEDPESIQTLIAELRGVTIDEEDDETEEDDI